MIKPEFPTTQEIQRWVLDTIRHAYHIEFYLQRLQVGVADIQRPHDIVGFGNKLDWPAIRGFALQYRGKDYFEPYVLPALHFHRQQYHHLAWNQFNPTASVDSMKLGAVDACCSLLEPRDYQGGCHTFNEVREVSLKNPIHKVPWMLLMASEMQKIERLDLTKISLKEIPKADLSPESRDTILERIFQTAQMLKQDHEVTLL